MRRGHTTVFLKQSVNARMHSCLPNIGVVSSRPIRLILNYHTGLDPGAIRFRSDKNSKPYLENATAVPLSFNLSHSGELAVVAVGEVSEIGVDVERIRPMPDWEEIAKGIFHQAETEWVRAAVADHRVKALFLRCGQRKRPTSKRAAAVWRIWSIPLQWWVQSRSRNIS